MDEICKCFKCKTSLTLEHKTGMVMLFKIKNNCLTSVACFRCPKCGQNCLEDGSEYYPSPVM